MVKNTNIMCMKMSKGQGMHINEDDSPQIVFFSRKELHDLNEIFQD